MTMLIQSDKCNICPCTHHEGIWEKGITTLCIINPVLLHTVPSDNILATNLSMLTFLSLHNISLSIKWSRWHFHSLHIFAFLFLWVMIFCITYPPSLALRGTWAQHVCGWSASHCTRFTLGENVLSTNGTGGWMGQFWPGSPVEVKNLLTLPGT